MTIKHRDLAGIDLNLVVALDALLTESSVTRAAAKVGITQSAMSSRLARLRRLLGDELLTRTPDGMRPTPRSLALVEPVRAALRQFQGIVLREDDFDPSTVERSFTLAIPGSVEVRLIPRLLAFLAREAPGIRLHLIGLDYGSVLGDLDADRIDMAVGMISEGQVHHKVRPLYRFGFLSLFNPRLLGVSGPLSLDDFVRFPHILTYLTGVGPGVVDKALAKVGRTRRLAATTPRFATVPFHVQAAPLIATMADELATTFATQLGLATSPVPVPTEEIVISMLWHASYDRDPAHRWLREVMVRLGREAGSAHREDAV